MDPLNPGLDNMDAQVSLPDLGELSVDFANYDDYNAIERVQKNFMFSSALADLQGQGQLGITRNRSQTFNLNIPMLANPFMTLYNGLANEQLGMSFK